MFLDNWENSRCWDVTLPESEPDLKAVTSGVPRPSRLHRDIVPTRRSLRAYGLLGGPAPICTAPPLRAAASPARKRLMRRRRRALALQGLVRRPRSPGIWLATRGFGRFLPWRGLCSPPPVSPWIVRWRSLAWPNAPRVCPRARARPLRVHIHLPASMEIWLFAPVG